MALSHLMHEAAGAQRGGVTRPGSHGMGVPPAFHTSDHQALPLVTLPPP